MSVGAAVAIALALALVSAALGRVAFPSEVTIRFDDTGEVERLRGKVRSLQPACVPRRRVLVYGDDAATAEEVYVLLGGDRTNARGRWYVERKDGGPIQPGRYYARVKRRELATGRCRSDRSATITVKLGAP